MTVPDEAVEAAARAAYEQVRPRMGFPTAYNEAPDVLKETYLGMGRAALTAAAPFIAAQAWDEGADFMSAGCWTETGSPGNPYRSEQ